jgi:hypothetical protein
MPTQQSISTAKIFDRDGYLVVKKALTEPLLSFAYRYACMKMQSGLMKTRDPSMPGTPSMYGDTFMETLLGLATPSFEKVVGLELFPTYSYFRVYKEGDILEPHIDRPSCEISVTMCLGYDVSNVADKDYVWPIYADNSLNYSEHVSLALGAASPDHGKAVRLEPGDCLVYRGCEVRHWREAFRGNHQAQVFLHYVDRNGPKKRYKFDGRPALGFGEEYRKENPSS